MTDFTFIVEQDDHDKRLDVFITQRLTAESVEDIVPSRSKVSSWISGENVTVDSVVQTKAGYRLESSQRVNLSIPDAEMLTLEPDPEVDIHVVFEDEHILVLDKQAGLVVHPAAGNYEKTLVHGVLAHAGESLKRIGDTIRPGIVHRLDKDTSGLMVVAKSDLAYQSLVAQFKPPRTITREYLAIALKTPFGSDSESGTIDAPIGRHPKNRKLMAVVPGSRKKAVTHWKVEERLSYGVLLRLKLETGRTHQIRVHLKHALAPIVGDSSYGITDGSLPQKLRPALRALKRQALHAASLSFNHPLSDSLDEPQRLIFNSSLPQDINSLLKILR